MNEVVMIMGASGSGKSTFTSKLVKEGYVLACLDEIRKEKYGYYEFKKDTDEIYNTFNDIVRVGVKSNKNVVLDGLHSSHKLRTRLVKMIRLANPECKIKLVHLNRDLETCIKQNRKRIGEKRFEDSTIEDIYKRIIKPTYSEGFDKIYNEYGDGILHLVVPE